MNPKEMSRLMKSMGIQTEEIDAERVIFELKDKKLVIENPSVTAMVMQGKKTYTVMGEATEESKGLPEEDVKMVASQAGVSEQKARKALEESNGDLAEAISKLKE